MNAGRRLIRAAMVVDGRHTCAAPGVVLLDGGAIVAAGAPEIVGTPEDAIVVDRSDAVILPALVNAHTHLDLTDVGPVPFDGDFVSWIEAVRELRPTTDLDIAAAVRHGIELSRTGGTALVGDIAGVGSRVPFVTMDETRMAGVSYLEVFGLGERQDAAVTRLAAAAAEATLAGGLVVPGLQPHAPYSCGPEVYRAATDLGRRLGCPLATHLAETPEEIEFAETGAGPMATMLARLGIDASRLEPGRCHPVDAFLATGPGPPCVVAHVNYAEPRHLDALAAAGVSVAYCPRASTYFGHPRDGHPSHAYHAMLEAGVNVALGTDSIIGLDRRDRISVLDEMRLLHARDGTDARTLLRMATTNGALALGFDPEAFTLADSPAGGLAGGAANIGGLLAVPCDPRDETDPWTQVLHRDEEPEWIISPGAPAWHA